MQGNMLPNGQPLRIAPMQAQIPPVNGMQHHPYNQRPPLQQQQQQQFRFQSPLSVPKLDEPPKVMSALSNLLIPLQRPQGSNDASSPVTSSEAPSYQNGVQTCYSLHSGMSTHAPRPTGPDGVERIGSPYFSLLPRAPTLSGPSPSDSPDCVLPRGPVVQLHHSVMSIHAPRTLGPIISQESYPPQGLPSANSSPTRGSALPSGTSKTDSAVTSTYSTPGSSMQPSAFKPFPPQSMPLHPAMRPVSTSQQINSQPVYNSIAQGPSNLPLVVLQGQSPLAQDASTLSSHGLPGCPPVPQASQVPTSFAPSISHTQSHFLRPTSQGTSKFPSSMPQFTSSLPPFMSQRSPNFHPMSQSSQVLPPMSQSAPMLPPGIPSQQQEASSVPSRPLLQQDHTSNMNKRYSTQAQFVQPQPTNNNINQGLASQMDSLSVTKMGFSKLWGMDTYDLMQMRNILPPEKVQPPKISLHQSLMESANCSQDIFRCTLTKIPESSSLLQKSRLPLGILIHPFKDLSQLPVIQCNTIVRCRACRTYINPFVYFVDHRRWKCNLCFRVNELPEEFQYDPVSKTYGDPSRRPEIKSSTIEFIAPSEYMLRPPQPAVYLFLLEVSRAALASGYLHIVCETLLEELDRLPGDTRTQIGFITFDSTLQFYGLNASLSQPQMMIVGDLEDVFLPCPDNLLVNLQESRELVRDLLGQLPSKFENTVETGSALGAALQASFKLMAATGGRVTVFQVSLPNCGPGTLQTRGPGNAKDCSTVLNPATDFFKRLALDCSGQQIAVDLFLLNSLYADLATLSGISRFSGGCIQHFPDFTASSALHTEILERSFRRYLTRKIGFEAVMRVRCTRGLAIHTFHGNFFVRSTDLLSLPNVNPDAGFGMQLSIEENLSDVQNVCFQAALLYTSSKGERRIRVHTLCLPIAANVSDILTGADQQCIVGLLAKMAVDRCQLSSLSDARDAFINVAVDVLSAYRLTQNAGPSGGLLAPHSLRLLPLYIVALLKCVAFRSSQNVRVDDRLFAMCQMKSLHLDALLQNIYPDLYPVHILTDEGAVEIDGRVIPQPPRLHLSAEKLDSQGLFLLDKGDHMILYAGRNIAPELCQAVLGMPTFEAIPDDMLELPELSNPHSQRLRNFLNHLQSEKPYQATLQIIREDSKHRNCFIQHLLEDRSESALSYYEFLQHLKIQVK